MTFSQFLLEFFSEKQIDASVYENYVISVLEDNTEDSEKIETLTDIFSSLIDVRSFGFWSLPSYTYTNNSFDDLYHRKLMSQQQST